MEQSSWLNLFIVVDVDVDVDDYVAVVVVIVAFLLLSFLLRILCSSGSYSCLFPILSVSDYLMRKIAVLIQTHTHTTAGCKCMMQALGVT